MSQTWIRDFGSSREILDSIIDRDQRDEHGLSGFILLLHLSAGPGRADQFHARLGEWLDYLAAKGYQFVAVDQLLEPESAAQRRAKQSESSLRIEEYARDQAALKAFRKRCGLER